VNPKISPEADKSLIEYYLRLREAGKRKGQIGAYARQLESLVRLSEAMAKMHLREWVTVEDVDRAYKFVKTVWILFIRFFQFVHQCFASICLGSRDWSH
jgi:DNA replicative helicase MCM subunit Mcm2 (Cdc46/Mcm family)